MTTLPELQCFNQLLLKKLARIEKENEALSSFENRYHSMRERYNSLVDLMSRMEALDDVFQCNQCHNWKLDDEAIYNESACCDCGWICRDCEEEWCRTFECYECECTFCKDCEEQEGGIHTYKDRLYCSECIDDAVKEDQEEQLHKVMEELIKKFAHSGI